MLFVSHVLRTMRNNKRQEKPEKHYIEWCFSGFFVAFKYEFLVFVYDDGKLIACGGLKHQWNENQIDSRIGRVRRFYVLPKYRKQGVGKQLLQHLEKNARPNFSALCLSVDNKSAAHFYQKQNYVFVENHPNYSYFKYLL